MKKTTSIKKNKAHSVSSVGAKPKKKISKVWKIVIIILSILSVGAVVYFCVKDINKNTAQYGQTIRDEKALFIGVEQTHNDCPVLLNVILNDRDELGNDIVLYSKSLSSWDAEMKTRESQPPEIVFYDFSEEVGQAINGYAIKNWLTEENYHNIECYVTSNGGEIVSAPFYVKDCGIWYLSTAPSYGAEISSYSWSLVIIKYVFTWSKVRISYE